MGQNQRQNTRRNHQRRMGQPTPKTTSRASETPPTNRPLRTMRPPTRTNGTVATPRPQPRPHRIPRLLTWRPVPCLRRTVQPASRSQESTSHPALQQTTQLRRTPLVSRRFLGQGRRTGVCAFNPRDPRLLRYHPMVRSLCLDTRYNARRFGSALVSLGSRDPPIYGVAIGTSRV
jgi:hypothetical protein